MCCVLMKNGNGNVLCLNEKMEKGCVLIIKQCASLKSPNKHELQSGASCVINDRM